MCWKRENGDADGSYGYENEGERKEGQKKRLWQSERDTEMAIRWEGETGKERDCERIIWPSLSLSLINDLGREALRSQVHEHTRRFNSMPGVSASPPRSLFPTWWRAARSSPHISPFSHISLINVQQSCKCKTDCSTVYMCVFVGTPASGVMKSQLLLVQVVFGLVITLHLLTKMRTGILLILYILFPKLAPHWNKTKPFYCPSEIQQYLTHYWSNVKEMYTFI